MEWTAEAICALGRKGLAIPAHVGKKPEVEDLVQKTLLQFGRIDFRVNNAGMNPSSLLDLEERTLDKILEVNLKGTGLLSQAVARRMVAQGGDGSSISARSAAYGPGSMGPGLLESARRG